MPTISDYFKQAQLALGAYANLLPGVANTQELQRAGFSVTQANQYGDKWIVVDQISDRSSGLSATVFKEISTGKSYLAIRGTDDLIDLATDLINIGLVGTTTLQPQYLTLRAKIQAWMSSGTLPARFTVTGHSLGGFLAIGIAAEFSANVEHAYLYNAPGLNGVLGIVSAPILRALRIAAPIGTGKVSNIRADVGVSPIAALGAQVALPIRIVIEDQFNSDVANPPAARNHSQEPLTDALALYALFSAVDPSISAGQMGDLLKAASAKNNRTLEGGLDALREIFGFSESTPIEQRESYYNNLYGLQTSPLFQSIANTEAGSNASEGRIVSLVSVDASQLASRAKIDFGYLFALNTLSPFAVTRAGDIFSTTHGELYGQWQADQSLTAADQAAGRGNFSDSYLQDRAQFLTWKNQKNINDIADGVSILRKDNGVASYLFTDKTLKDAQGQDYSIRVVGGNPLQQADPIRISFASDQGDALQGGNFADHLYGGIGSDAFAGSDGDDYLEGGAGADTLRGDAGDDTLIGGNGDDTLIGDADDDTLDGGKGNDTLQGGAGNDFYLISAGDGHDTIIDHEGRNTIIYTDANGKRSVLGVPAFAMAGQPNTWFGYLADGGSITFTRNSPLTAILPDGSQIVFDDYQDGEFGIQLKDLAQSEPEATGVTLLGDLEPIHYGSRFEQGVEVYWEAGEDELGNIIVYPSKPAPDTLDWLFGSDGNDFIAGLGGNDRIFGREGADYLQGGAGADYIYGEGGDDVIEGQGETLTDTDVDRLSGGAGDDWIFATAECDFEEALAHANDAGLNSRGARMMGEAGDDVIVGSTGEDRIAGGAGSDLLIGGGGGDVILGDADLKPAFNGEYGPDQGTAVDDADVIYGGGGGDSIRGGLGDDYVDGGDGDDIIFGEGGSDTLFGGAGGDSIFAIVNETNLVVFDESDDYIDGGDGNDWIYGSAGDNILLGGDGEDDICGGGGNDYVDGGNGNDRIQGNDAHGGAGNDVVAGTPGADTLHGDDGDDVLSGWSSLWDLPYAVEYVAGDDWLYGGAGNDTYMLALGTGTVHIVDDSGVNRIVLTSYEIALPDPAAASLYAPIAADSIRFESEGGTYKLIYGDAGDCVDLGASLGGTTPIVNLNHIGLGFRVDDDLDPEHLDPQPYMDTSTELVSWSDIVVNQSSAPEGGTLIAAEGFSNTLVGKEGNDLIIGASRADVLTGGVGDDTLDGGDGGDRYVFNPGDGVDVIADSGTQGADTLVFGPGISPDALSLGTGSLLIRIGGSGDAVHIDGFDLEDAGASSGIEFFEFADGTVLSHAQLVSRGFDLYGTDADDIVYGTSVVDRFHESAGDDSLIGGAGDDVYYFGLGSGLDFVIDLDATPNNSDTIVLGTGFAPEDLMVQSSPGMLSLAVAGADDRLDIQWQPQAGYAIERVQFADGTIWDSAMLDSRAVPVAQSDDGGAPPAAAETPGAAATAPAGGGASASGSTEAASPVDEGPLAAVDDTSVERPATSISEVVAPASNETTPSAIAAVPDASGATASESAATASPADEAPPAVVVDTQVENRATSIGEIVAPRSNDTKPGVIAAAPAAVDGDPAGNLSAPAADAAPSIIETASSFDGNATAAAIDGSPARDNPEPIGGSRASAAAGGTSVLPHSQPAAIQSQQDALFSALRTIGAADSAAPPMSPRDAAKPADTIGAPAASEQTATTPSPASFFTALQPARPNLQSWLDNWLGPRGRASAGVQENPPPPAIDDTELPSAQDFAPPNPSGDIPEAQPAEALTPEEIAQSYEDIAAWLAAHPGIEQGSAGAGGSAPEKNPFTFIRSGAAGDAGVASIAGFGQSPGMPAIGGHALQPLRGISEGYTPLGVI